MFPSTNRFDLLNFKRGFDFSIHPTSSVTPIMCLISCDSFFDLLFKWFDIGFGWNRHIRLDVIVNNCLLHLVHFAFVFKLGNSFLILCSKRLIELLKYYLFFCFIYHSHSLLYHILHPFGFNQRVYCILLSLVFIFFSLLEIYLETRHVDERRRFCDRFKLTRIKLILYYNPINSCSLYFYFTFLIITLFSYRMQTGRREHEDFDIND